jgi:radical SAM protein with 4Fe4S-binding SPASM domain
VANLRALRAAGKRLSTRATVTRDGLPYLRDLVDDATDLGIHHVQVEPASVVGRGANLADGPPEPLGFADAFLDAFDYALDSGVELTTAAWSSTRVGDGRYCGAISGSRALTPDGFVSACTEACDGNTPDDPFIVGRLDTIAAKLEIWPIKEAALAQRTGHNLATCHDCYLVDTCAGGCASRAQAQSGSAFVRDDTNCVASRHINPRMIADLADHRLLPDEGWQPIQSQLKSADSAFGDASLTAIVPPYALRRWNTDPDRRPFFGPPPRAGRFFHRPAEEPMRRTDSAIRTSVAP